MEKDVNDILGDVEELSFEERMILVEEMGIEKLEVDEESETPFFLEKRDFRKTTQFTPKGDDINQDELPIHGKGKLDSFVVVAGSDNYDVNVSVDNRDVVDDSFQQLSSISNELEGVSAYESGQSYVVSVNDYPFKEALHISVRPREDMMFKRVRVEGVLE